MAKRNGLYTFELKLESLERRLWKKGRKVIRKEGKLLVKWLFFYIPDSMGDAILHIVDVLCLVYIALRLAGGM
jgi:hypothetical protein